MQRNFATTAARRLRVTLTATKGLRRGATVRFRQPDPEQRAFAGLKKILCRWAPALIVARNEPHAYRLDTPSMMKSRRPLMFGAVYIRKTYVSFRLQPLLTHPELAATISPALRLRQQGKSSFNFAAPNERLFAELKDLTRDCYRDFVRRGHIG